jgi:hypothetical protein
MRITRLSFLIPALAATSLLAAGACGSGNKQVKASAGLAVDSAATKIDASRCDPKGKQMVPADIDGDQKPDVFKLYAAVSQGGQQVQIMTCKQVDLNHDEKVDAVYHYDNGGVKTVEEFDLDFDGRFDLRAFFQSGRKVREEMDQNYDNRTDFTKYFEAEKLVRIERDTNRDGRVDEWQYFEAGRLDRIGYDTTGSGRVDRWDHAPEGAESSAAPATTPEAAPAPTAAPSAPAPPAGL